VLLQLFGGSSPAIVDREVLALHPAELAQAVEELLHAGRALGIGGGLSIMYSDPLGPVFAPGG